MGREKESVALLMQDEEIVLPDDLDYFTYIARLMNAKSDRVHGLSTEEKIRLSEARPGTLAAAKRLEGITPVGILELIRYSTKASNLLRK